VHQLQFQHNNASCVEVGGLYSRHTCAIISEACSGKGMKESSVSSDLHVEIAIKTMLITSSVSRYCSLRIYSARQLVSRVYCMVTVKRLHEAV
jgi:hypothetical protein